MSQLFGDSDSRVKTAFFPDSSEPADIVVSSAEGYTMDMISDIVSQGFPPFPWLGTDGDFTGSYQLFIFSTTQFYIGPRSLARLLSCAVIALDTLVLLGVSGTFCLVVVGYQIGVTLLHSRVRLFLLLRFKTAVAARMGRLQQNHGTFSLVWTKSMQMDASSSRRRPKMFPYKDVHSSIPLRCTMFKGRLKLMPPDNHAFQLRWPP